MPQKPCALQQQIRARHKRLVRRCRALDIPDKPCGCPPPAKKCGCAGPCDCPGQTLAGQFSPPCRHVLAAEHDYGWDPTLEDDDAVERQLVAWARLLLAVFGRAYRDPPPPKRPANALSRQARVRKMARRSRAGVRLYHPEDPWRRENRDKYRVKTLISRLRNGALDEEEGLAAEDEKGQVPEAKWPYASQPVAAQETPRQQARRERADRVSALLVQLGATGTFDAASRVDYARIYEEPLALPLVAARGRRAAA